MRIRRFDPIIGLLVSIFTLGVCTFAFSSTATAQSYRFRSITIGRAYQYMRADLTTGAPRSFSQGLSLRGYDLAGDGTGSTSAYLSVRYDTDFGLPSELRDDPWAGTQWNQLTLDAAWMRWRPWETFETTLGRQTTWDAAGWRDFDGARLSLRPMIGEARLRAEIWGGLEVIESTDARWASDSYDVQGLPPNDPYRGGDGPGWVLGSRGGISLEDDGHFELAWSRRHYRSESASVLGSETFGAALSLSPFRRVSVASRASYQTVIEEIDHAALDIAWAIPFGSIVATAGVEQRHPWFDSGSIWNIFGAQPHEGANATLSVPVPAISSDFELRGWGRIYHGDVDSTDFGSSDADARAVGSALAHRARFAFLGLPWRWRMTGSGQWTRDEAQGGDQYLVDAELGASVARNEAFVYLRGIQAWVTPGATSRFGDGQATNGVLGGDLETSFGRLGVVVDVRYASWQGTSTALYGTFEVEEWR